MNLPSPYPWEVAELLARGIVEMSIRYGQSRADMASTPRGSSDHAYAERAAARRLRAVRWLTAALAKRSGVLLPLGPGLSGPGGAP